MNQHLSNLVKSILSCSVVLAFCIQEATAQNVPELIYYKFNQAGTTTTNLASAPVSATGTVQGTATIGGVGMVGTALQGSGAASGSNSVNANWPMNLTGAWTMSLWMSGVTNTLSSNYLFGGAGGSTFRAMTGSGLVSGAGNLLVRATGMTDVNFPGIFDATGTPVVIHIVYDPTIPATLAYVNGVYSSTQTQTATMVLTGTNFLVGGQAASVGLPTNGKIDEFRLYNRAVPASEIGLTWNVELPMGGPDDGGMDSLLTPTGNYCSGMQQLSARIKNYGQNDITSVNINWSINGVLQTPLSNTVLINSISNPVNYHDIVLGNANIPYGVSTEIKAWTSLPNGVADSDNTNDTLTINLNPPTEGVTVAITPEDTIVCSGSLLTLDAGTQPAGAIFIWNTGGLTQTIEVDETGSYSVKVQSLGGCIDEDTVNVTFAPPPAAQAILITPTSSNSFVFNLFAEQHVDAYTWNYGDGSNEEMGAPPKSHLYDEPGVYTVTCTLSNSCGESVVSRPVSATVTSIDDLEMLQNNIKLFPNPAKDKVSITLAGNIVMEHISIYNLLGQKIFSTSVSGSSYQLNTSDLPNGMYSLVISTSKGSITKKMQILK